VDCFTVANAHLGRRMCFLVLWIQNQLLLKEIEDLRRKVKHLHIIYMHFLKQTPSEQHDGSYEDHIYVVNGVFEFKN
jgi:hypothetical protein